MRRISHRRCQHDFGIGGELDLPHLVACVRERHAADLGVILWRDDDFECRRDRSVTPNDPATILAEGEVVAVCLDAARLIAGGPYVAALDIAEKDVCTPIVTSDVFAPAGHC